MWLSRPQFRLRTLVVAVLLVGLALGAVKAWQQRNPTRPSWSKHFASEVLAVRAARTIPGRSNNQDPILLAGLVTAALFASEMRRRLRGQREPTP